ncbi:unnamed protein product [Urochloa humidicola]
MSTSSDKEQSDEDMPECSDDDDDFMVVYAAMALMNDNYDSPKKARSIPRIPGSVWTEILLEDSDKCYETFRMRRTVFHHLLETLETQYGLKSTREVSSKEALAMFLWTCGAPQSNRTVKNFFHHSTETISRKFGEVLASVTRMAAENIKPKDPQFTTIHPRLEEPRFWPHFKDCIGAIDGSHIPVTVPLSETPKYVGRHGYASQNIMAVCDFDLRFTFVVTGWPGSAHDTRILNDTLITYAHKFPKPPPGKYYLVDSGYPNKEGYLAPYKGQRYHVPEFQQSAPVGLKEVFNHAHSSLRNAIERCFGILNNKWRILKQMPSYPIQKQAEIIVACMSLHNFIRDSALYDDDFENYEDEIPEDFHDDASIANDEYDMGAFRDSIAAALLA